MGIQSWIIINNDIFYVHDSNIQPVFFESYARGTLYLTFDTDKYTDYKLKFFKLYENKLKFDIISKFFEAKGVFIKIIDFSNQFINVTFSCDMVRDRDMVEVRDVKIQEILNNKLN